MTIMLNTPINPGIMYTQKLFSSPTCLISMYPGIKPPLKYIVMTNSVVTNLLNIYSLRLST
ncbi:hypothetical protein D3C74_479060 [compost metagenome]